MLGPGLGTGVASWFIMKREPLMRDTPVIRNKENSIFLMSEPQKGSGSQWYKIAEAGGWGLLQISNYWSYKYRIFFDIHSSYMLFLAWKVLANPSFPTCIILVYPSIVQGSPPLWSFLGPQTRLGASPLEPIVLTLYLFPTRLAHITSCPLVMNVFILDTKLLMAKTVSSPGIVMC